MPDKEIAERLFIKELLAAGGVKTYGSTHEYGHEYFFFNLKNGTRRYWMDLSDEGFEELLLRGE